MVFRTIIGSMILGVLFTANAQYKLSQHPRIFINPESLPGLVVKAEGSGLTADDYVMIKKEADEFVRRKSFRKINSVWHRPTDMLCTALAYLVERAHGNAEANKYARAIVAVWGDGSILSRSGSGHFGSFAIAYDWIYDAMTAAERKRFGDKLGEWLFWYTNTPEIVLRYGDWLYNQTWGPAHLNTPNTRDGITGKLFVALALKGAGTVHENACSRFLDSWYQRIPADCIPRFDRMGGVWSESMGHGVYGPVRVIPWAFEAWRTATGLDWFQLGTSTTFLKEMNAWAVHLSLPFDHSTAYIDDNSGGLLENYWNMTGPILGARYADPVANEISRRFDRGTWPRDWFSIPWIRFIAYDPLVEPKTPGQAGWPTARLFTGAGHVYMRSDWDDPNATWAFFGAGPWYANHSRDDEGHFLIARKGWLVLRGGGMGHNDDDYYAGGSLVYNIVTIFDSTEVFRRLTPGANRLAEGGTKNERDGGIIRHVYGHPHDMVIERGTMVAFEHENDYTYAAADLTEAYRSNKVREVTRQFVYLRGRREFFVIFDRVDATNPNFPKHWFLHIPSEPSVRGTETERTPGHVYSSADARFVTWLSDSAGSPYEMRSAGKARAFLKTVLPRGAVVTRRGGEGHDLWGHPDEPTAQYNHAGKRSNRPPVVPWRLEVQAPRGQTRDYFLHVLEIGEEQDTAMSAITLLEPDSGTVGVRIVDPYGKPVEVYFARLGPLDFELQSGITSVSSARRNENKKLELGLSYPNPVSSSASGAVIPFEVRGSERTITLKIFNTLGREVRTLVDERIPEGKHTVTWNGRDDSGLPVEPGVYFYVLKSGDGIRLAGKLLWPR